MSPPRNKILLASLTILLPTFLFYTLAHTSNSFAQGDDQSLNIERHANEPLELVDVKVSEKSIKNGIQVKFRSGEDGRDKAEFKDKEDWFKRIRITMRNNSGRTIVGLQAYLYFKPFGSPILFSASMKGSKQLEHTALAPNAEIEMTADEDSLDRTVNRIKEHGGDPNLAEVTFSVEIVGFSDGLQWHKGHLLRVDPDNPSRRIPVETKKPLAFRALDSPTWFTQVGFHG